MTGKSPSRLAAHQSATNAISRRGIAAIEDTLIWNVLRQAEGAGVLREWGALVSHHTGPYTPKHTYTIFVCVQGVSM